MSKSHIPNSTSLGNLSVLVTPPLMDLFHSQHLVKRRHLGFLSGNSDWKIQSSEPFPPLIILYLSPQYLLIIFWLCLYIKTHRFWAEWFRRNFNGNLKCLKNIAALISQCRMKMSVFIKYFYTRKLFIKFI